MKIAYLANVRFPSERAHAVQVFHMCKAFSDNGAELTLFVNKINQTDTVAVEKYFDAKFNFKIKRLTRGPFLPKFKPSYYFGEIAFSISFLLSKEREDFDIVYSRHEWIVWFLSLFIDVERLVWESHEAKFNFPARRLLKKVIKTVVISEGIFDFYKSKNVPDKQMLVAYDGIDDSFFGPVESRNDARFRLGLPLEEKIVMYIGGFDKWKGVETFFATAKLCPRILFTAIGGSKEQVEVYSKQYPEVVFLGQKPYFELKNNQQAADILVIPNTVQNELSEKFTSPLKLFAHMTSGIPMIVTDIPSLISVTGRDLVTVVSPDSSEALKSGISEIFVDYVHCLKSSQKLCGLSKAYEWNGRAFKIVTFIG